MDKKFTVAIVGCGSRGCEAYGRLFLADEKKWKVVSICDVSPLKLKKYSEVFGISEDNCFSDEDKFFEKRRADVVVIATLDKDHVRQVKKAMPLGYDILLEKPITDDLKECYDLLKLQKKYKNKIMVCHVLRYAPPIRKIYDLIEEGKIGRLVNINAVENVCYWHQAHSYVRGNWRKAETTTPMIMAKCCHDLDLFTFFAKSACKTLSSFGDLTYFNIKNAPEGSADRCVNCKCSSTCPYSAEKVYIDNWKAAGCPENVWPFNVPTQAVPITEADLRAAIKDGPYGKCVFRCDNDVVDHQQVSVEFDNGVTATLTMMGFTGRGGRIYRFFGTLGQITFDEQRGVIEVEEFAKPMEVIDLASMNEGGFGHAGGDNALINGLYAVLSGDAESATTLEQSLESHKMCIAAEESRKHGGKAVRIK